MMKLRIKEFTETRGDDATKEMLAKSSTVGELIDHIREALADDYYETGELPVVGYIEFVGENGKQYVVWLDPIVMEVDETIARNTYIHTCER